MVQNVRRDASRSMVVIQAVSKTVNGLPRSIAFMNEVARAREPLAPYDVTVRHAHIGSFGIRDSPARRHSNGQWYTSHKHSEQHNVLNPYCLG